MSSKPAKSGGGDSPGGKLVAWALRVRRWGLPALAVAIIVSLLLLLLMSGGAGGNGATSAKTSKTNVSTSHIVPIKSVQAAICSRHRDKTSSLCAAPASTPLTVLKISLSPKIAREFWQQKNSFIAVNVPGYFTLAEGHKAFGNLRTRSDTLYISFQVYITGKVPFQVALHY